MPATKPKRVKELLKEIAGLAQDDSDDICELGWSLSEILEKAMLAIKEIEDNGCTLEDKDKTMKYIVSVTRIGYGGLDLEVEADSEDKAKEIALDQAGGESFSEHHSEYQVEYMVPAADIEDAYSRHDKARVLEQLAISGDQHAMVKVINALLDDDYGVSEAAYSAMKDAGMVPTDIANRVKATDGRFYLSSVSRDELERDFHE